MLQLATLTAVQVVVLPLIASVMISVLVSEIVATITLISAQIQHVNFLNSLLAGDHVI